MNKLQSILKELSEVKGDSDESYGKQILSPVTDPPEQDLYITSLIDIRLEKKLLFLMNHVNSSQFPRYIQWIFDAYTVRNQLY
jgi:hypothetical protein